MAVKPDALKNDPNAVTKNYGFTIFPDTEEVANLTFKEFRDWLAGSGNSENPEEFSTIQQIDTCFASMVGEIEKAKIDAINKAQEFYDTHSDLIDEDDDSINIGRIEDNDKQARKPLEFYDDTQISYLEGGKFTVGGVATDYIDLGNYAIEYKPDNDHLQIFYKFTDDEGGVE